jgi:hypothetical protein
MGALMSTSGVALLAELEGLAQRNAPKVVVKIVEPVKPVALRAQEVMDAFLRSKRGQTYVNLQKVLQEQGLEVQFFKRG